MDHVDCSGALDILATRNHLLFSGASTKTVMSVDKSSGEKTGGFLNRGRGPGEVLYAEYFMSRPLRVKDEREQLGYQDSYQLWQWADLEESLIKGSPEIVETQRIPEDFKTVFPKTSLEDGLFWGIRLKDMAIGYERSLQNDSGSKEIPQNLSLLNKAAIQTEQDGVLVNVLSVLYGYNRWCGRMVEASLYLNTIHIYDLDGAFAKTICLGRRLTNYLSVEKRFKALGYSEETFLILKMYKDFFAVLQGDGKSVCLFDMNGEFLQVFHLPYKATTFDFDVFTGLLYTLNSEKEEIRFYETGRYGKYLMSGERF